MSVTVLRFGVKKETKLKKKKVKKTGKKDPCKVAKREIDYSWESFCSQWRHIFSRRVVLQPLYGWITARQAS